MNKVTQNNAVSAEECARAAGEMNAQNRVGQGICPCFAANDLRGRLWFKVGCLKERDQSSALEPDEPQKLRRGLFPRTAADPKNQQEGFAMPDNVDFKNL